jgi:hypothetical protein
MSSATGNDVTTEMRRTCIYELEPGSALAA